MLDIRYLIIFFIVSGMNMIFNETMEAKIELWVRTMLIKDQHLLNI